MPLATPSATEKTRPSLRTFISREPIVDGAQRVYGYRLRFRSGLAQAFSHRHATKASLRVIGDSQLVFGLKRLASGVRAFVPFTRDTLLQGYASVFPPSEVVVEILAEVAPDDEVIACCRDLKQAGYALAVDGSALDDLAHPFLALGDIVAVDFRATSPGAQRQLAEALAPRGRRLLAEWIETAKEFAAARALGYAFFQGDFLSAPALLSHQEVPTFKLTHLELLREIHRYALDRGRVEALITRDPALLYKLLRFINSASMGLRRRIDSVAQCLALIGDDGLRKFLSLVTLGSMVSDRPQELAVRSFVRGNFCEALARGTTLAPRAADVFLVGLFSLLDAIVGRPLEELLDGLAIPGDVRAALLGKPNPLGDVYACATAYERGDWPAVAGSICTLGLDEGTMPELYARSVEHGTALFSSVVAGDASGAAPV